MRTKKATAAILSVSTVASSWLLMQIIHESGHVLGAFATGGHIRRVILVPWEFSRTDLMQNPLPLFVCWAGPIFGALAPVIVWLIAVKFHWSVAFWLQFFAGFCLIANGAYIGIGAFTHNGDGGDLLKDGSPIGTLWVFGAVTVPWGFFLWHRLGREFGIGAKAREIPWRVAAVSLLLLTVIVVMESLFSQI